MTSQIIVSSDEPPQLTPNLDTLILTHDKSIGIDSVKSIKTFLQTKPLEKALKTIIIYPADRLTLPAQNALLKILEEPPEFALIQLLTSNPNSLLPTLLSRCDLIDNQVNQLAGTTNQALPKFITDLTQQKKAVSALKYLPQKPDRYELMSDIYTSLQYFSDQLLNQPAQPTAAKTKLLLEAYQHLRQNANVTITLTQICLHWPYQD